MSDSPMVELVIPSPNRDVMTDKINRKITIHHMMELFTIEQCGALFANPERQASSNYGIDSRGRVGLYVPEKDRSWCSSSYENDCQAITIEVANNTGEPDWTVSAKAFETLILLCADICRRNGIPKLVWTGTPEGNLTTHDMFRQKNCPGPYLKPRMPEIARRVNALLEKDPE